MIDFEGYYAVDAAKVEYVSSKNGGGENPYGLFINLTSGKELGVWYRTDASRKRAREMLLWQIEGERQRDAETIRTSLYMIEQTVKGIDKRQFKIWRQLKALLGIPAEERDQ